VQQIEAARAAAGLPPRGTSAGAAPAAAPAPEAVSERPPGAEEDRCTGVCRASGDICRFSEQICRLAGEIADEDSRRSCERAQTDCADASRLCKSCR
jgi:hypothetical protein